MAISSRDFRGFALVTLLLTACNGTKSVDVAEPQDPAKTSPAADDPVPTTPIAPPNRVTTVEGITEYRLANGMRVLLFPDESQATVTVNVTYFVGSRHEGYGEAGMAHLLEHMVFKGTTKRPNIWKDLQDRGARFNGTTWVDRTNYYETLPATGDNLKWALMMEADRMVNSLIDPDELAKEFSVVRNEFEQRENDPINILGERIESTAYLWHNYGRSTIGNRSDIERVPASSLRRFYEKHYQPDNAMLVIAGRFEPDNALEIVNKTFGAIPKPDREIEATYTVEPVQDGERDVTLRRVGNVQAFGVAYHTVPATHVDAIPLEAASEILTREPSGRLHKLLVETKKATRVWGNTFPFAEASLSQFYAEVPVGKDLGAVEEAIIKTVEGFGKSKITDDEVKRFRTKALKDWELAFSSSGRIAILLSEFAAMGDWRMLFVYRDRLEKLKPADVSAAAKKYFLRSNRTTGRFIPTNKPDRAPAVEQPSVAALVDGYKGRGKVAAGEKFEATLDNIERRTERLSLKNGMKVALLAKKTRGQKVSARMTLRYGSERDLRGKSAAVALLPDMLMRGTKTKNYQQIRDALDALKANVSFDTGGFATSVGNELTITIQTTNDNLVKVIALVGEILQQPSFPADEFKIVRDKAVASLEKEVDNPQILAFLSLIRKVNPFPKNDSRYTPTLDEAAKRAKKVRLADLTKFHKDFYGASYGEVAIVGDFDSDAVKEALAATFGEWTAKKKYVRIGRPHKNHKGESVEINTPDKKMTLIVAGHTVKIKDDAPDYAALELGAYILGGGGSSRLMTRLRHKGGLSYSAAGFMQASSHEASGIVVGYAICAPENADKALAGLRDEFDKLVKKGVGDKELKDAIKAYLEGRKGRLTNDGSVAGDLAQQLELGRTTAFQAALNAKIKTLTPAQVNAAIKKYIKPNRLVAVTAGDLAKKTPAK